LKNLDIPASGSSTQQLHRLIVKIANEKCPLFLGAWMEIKQTIIKNYECLCEMKELLGDDSKYISTQDNKWIASVPADQDTDELCMTKTFESPQEAVQWAKLGL